jgi:hypothetical protein
VLLVYMNNYSPDISVTIDASGLKVIEITGPPGSGKSTFIENYFMGQQVLLGALPLSYGTFRRLVGSIVLSFYALVTGSVSFRQTTWLLAKAVRYDETKVARLNALRNCMMKFGDRYFTSRDCLTILDEGISHIPFILGLANTDIDEFVELFEKHLEDKQIVFVEAPPKELLVARLLTRGHKRIRASNDVEAFVERNLGIAEYYKRVLIDSGFDVTIV